MAEKTWNELTPGQQAYLGTLARAGGEWVDTIDYNWFSTESFRVLLTNNLIEFNGDFDDRITAKGLLVWQQGQTPAESDELTRLREQVVALKAERDALVQAGNAVLDEVTVNKRGFISIAIGATVHSWNKSTGMGGALFALREVLIASAKKRTGNE